MLVEAVSYFAALTIALAMPFVAPAVAATQSPAQVHAVAYRAHGPAAPKPAETAMSDSCTAIAPPPSRLATVSKYDQAISSKSVVDRYAANTRKEALAQTTRSIAQLVAQAGLNGRSVSDTSPCAAGSLLTWAESGALTDMASSDANLSRDRFVVDIVNALTALKIANHDLSKQAAVRKWLVRIGEQTMHFYDWQAGPNSRRNNHRYWAGLSVGAIGYFLQDPRMVGWAKRSFETGVCQIDAEGYLPLEMARGAKALDYHLYAYRALASFEDLARTNGDMLEGDCTPRLKVLEARIRDGLLEAASFEIRSGYTQDMPARQSMLHPVGMTLLQVADQD